jgi:hypothetical protein
MFKMFFGKLNQVSAENNEEGRKKRFIRKMDG